jgi:hypothetical protein
MSQSCERTQLYSSVNVRENWVGIMVVEERAHDLTCPCIIMSLFLPGGWENVRTRGWQVLPRKQEVTKSWEEQQFPVMLSKYQGVWAFSKHSGFGGDVVTNTVKHPAFRLGPLETPSHFTVYWMPDVGPALCQCWQEKRGRSHCAECFPLPGPGKVCLCFLCQSLQQSSEVSLISLLYRWGNWGLESLITCSRLQYC